MVIWYNTKCDIYERGSRKEYDTITAIDNDRNDYSVVYELSELSSTLADKLLEELNSVRQLRKAV